MQEALRRAQREKNTKDMAIASRELRALDEHEVRLTQEANTERALSDHPAWEMFRTHLLNTIGECPGCSAAILGAMPGGDTRSE
jgi:hypothetical protein